MPKAHRPRHGSMQVWPRVRAKRMYPAVKGKSDKPKMTGFAAYKAGMTHIIIDDQRKNTMTKGEKVKMSVTVLECPPMRIAGVRFYKKKYKTIQPANDIMAKPDKDIARKIDPPKKEKNLDSVKPEDYDDLTLLVQTQPRLTGLGKKKPELFEISIGGKKEDKFNYAKENLGKDLNVSDVFQEGQLVDIRAVTRGKGFQGPVKRFGIKIRHHKSEKTKRGPGSLGGWSKQVHVMYRVSHAGQMGFHNRVDYNKLIMKIGSKPEEINPAGGFVRYGDVKNTYILLKGSIPGPSKRMVRLETAIRPNKRHDTTPQRITYISTTSKQ
ncbi:50S ribosomal protein L3 [Candidatus Woesearchaeota archaeon]|nr:50S ribosomal protein L3 [Candidatus Woesearchaeota archaeon]